jgi:hypothetical protein
MAWWSKLAQVGAVVAAPFTGGTTLALLPAISAAAQMAGNYADQKGAEKKAKIAAAAGQTAATMAGAAGASADARLKQDATNAGIYKSIVEAEAARVASEQAQAKFALEAGGARAGQIAKADLLRGATKFSMGGPGSGEGAARMEGWKPTGGIDPSLFGADSKRAADLLVARNLGALEKGEEFNPMKLPEAPTTSKAGLMENIMGIGGTVGTMAQPWLDILMQSKTPMPTIDAGTAKPFGTSFPLPGGGTSLPKATFAPLDSKPISGLMTLPRGR